MKYLRGLLAVMIVVFASLIFVTPPSPASAATRDALCSGASVDLTGVGSDGAGADEDSCDNGDPCEVENDDGTCKQTEAESKVNSLVTFILNIFSTIIGIVAVIMIITAGLKYITSGGDSGKVNSAKSTIIYALVGLFVVAIAQFLVRFILAKIN
jgi:Type IV secretion system pilin